MSARSKVSRASAGVVLLTLSLTGMIRAAYADCSPNSTAAITGNTITCSATVATGLVAGGAAATAVTDLTVNVDSTATISPALPAANISVGVKVNASSTVNNAGSILNTGGTGTGTGGSNGNIGVWLSGDAAAGSTGDGSLVNSGSISVSITAADIAATAGKNARTVTGVLSQLAGSYSVTNTESGSITVTHGGVGPVRGVFAGGATVDMTLDNAGTISLVRSSGLTLTVTSAGVPQAVAGITGATIAAANLGLAAAVDSEEEVESMTILNRATGVISAAGQADAYNGAVVAIYGRAGELSITNHGTITSTAIAIANVDGGGDDDEPGEAGGGETDLKNTGTITGDILFVDGNPVRYWLQYAKGVQGLQLNNQAGIRSSELENSGTINGNIYLGSGEHEIENEGTINGSIFVNQVGVVPDAVNGGFVHGDREFELTNSGTLDGNIEIHDVAGAHNSIVLINDGFTGNITATTGAGDNSLTLLGVGTLHNVSKLSTLTVGPEGGAGGGGDDDDDDDAPAPLGAIWTLASGTTQEFTSGATINTGAILIVDSTLTTRTVNVLNGGTLMGAGTIAGSIDNSGIIDLRTVNSSGKPVNSTLTVTGSVTLEAGSILRTTISGNGSASADAPSSNAGLLKVGATGTADPGAKIVPVQETPGLVRNGDWYRVATNTNGGSVFDSLPSVQNSALITWTVKENADSDLVIGATVRNANTIPGVTSGGAGALNTLNNYSGDNAKLLSLIGALQSLPTDASVRKAAEQLRPEANGGQSHVALSINDRINAVIDQRIAATNLTAYGTSGVSTGEGGSGRAGWVQGFGFYGTQDQIKGIDGYTASSAGIALGADTAIGSGDATRIGIALSYASSKIDDDGINDGNTVKIDSYQATLYGSYAMPTWYINGALGLGFHKYDSTRFITVGALRDSASASHDGTQYSAKVEGGLPMKFGKNTLIPVASLQYSHLDQDAYTESSNLGTALAVDKVRTDSVRSGLGAKVLFDISEPDTQMAVELRAIWLHEFGNTSQDSTARFAAGGSSFTTSGADIGRDSANLGIGMRFSSANSRQQILIGYDAEIRDKYVGHTAMLQARQEF